MSYKRLSGVLAAITLVSFGLYMVGISSVSATTDTFTVTGSWVAPAGVTSVTVDAWAAGGGGANGSSGGADSGGGGGGAFSEQTAITVVPGNSYTVTVGVGGIGGVVFGVAATPGGDSWFSTTGTVIAKGGNSSSIGGSGGGGGAATGVGSTQFAGGSGGNPGAINAAGGGGAGTTATGGNASGNIPGTGGTVGGGNGGFNAAGSVKGGGGSGGAGGSNGFAGARGEIQITYTIPPTSTGQSAIKLTNGQINIQNGSIIIQPQ